MRRIPRRMRNLEYLFRTLPKLINLTFNTHFFNGILDCFDIDHPLICKRMEQIESFYGLLTPLFIPENQIDPVMQILRNIFRLQCLSHYFKENIRIAIRPLWYLYISDFLFILPYSEIQIHIIFKEQRILLIKFWD